MAQRVAILIDEFSTDSPEAEKADILKDLTRQGLEPDLVWFGHQPPLPDTTQVDLLVVDFGALGGGYLTGNGPSLTQRWTDFVIHWAEDHPGTLVMLWSGMTADYIVDGLAPKDADGYAKSMADWADWPDNVRALHSGNSWSANWKLYGSGVDWLQASHEKLRSWFNITGETAIEREVKAAGPLVTPGSDDDWA